MALNTLETAYANGEIIDASHINELTLALLGDFVGRDALGVPTPGQNLGTLAIQWGNVYATGLILDGLALDPTLITNVPNRIVSGKARSLSSLSDFLRANGAALEFTLEAATTNLVLSINNQATTFNTDEVKSGITAAPSTNNTCDVNDTNIVNDKYAGEIDAFRNKIIIDNAGSEISNRIGQIAAFQTPTGEILQGLIKSATEIENVYRGFYFNSAGTPIERGILNNNDALTLLQVGWVFAEDDGNTIDITYRTPVISFTSPTAPQTGDYWFDISNQLWKRYSGTSFDIINRTLIGQVVSDDTNTIATRSYDFSNQFREINNVEIVEPKNEIVESLSDKARVNIYGTELQLDLTELGWNITTDLETGLVEANSTTYYLYLSDKGRRVISDKRPHKRPDLKGFYHPYESYRCVGSCFNNSAGNLVISDDVKYNSEKEHAIIKVGHEESSTTQGGTMPTGSFTTKKLNVKTPYKGDFLELVTNQMFLLDGEYKIEGYSYGMECGAVRTRAQNISTGLTAVTGSNGYSSSAGSSPEMSPSILEGYFVIQDTQIMEIQIRGGLTGPGYAQGFPSSFGIQEVYAEYILTKIG